MKTILFLLPFFVSFVASQSNSIYCRNGKCPRGYTRRYRGRDMLNSVCICYKDPVRTTCDDEYEACLWTHSKCSSLLSKCTPAEVLKRCDRMTIDLDPEMCDKAAEMIRPKSDKNIEIDYHHCVDFLKECNSGDSHSCDWAAQFCGLDVALELCKQNKVSSSEICFEAEKKQERLKAQSAKYRCQYSEKHCNEGYYCEGLVEFCDSETVARKCYKGDFRNKEACINAIQKSQYLMEPVNMNDCNQEIAKCARGNFDGCIKVATVCGKEAVSSLCRIKIITNELMCTYAGVKLPPEPDYPGCDFFSQGCLVSTTNYAFCDLASLYCGNKNKRPLCTFKEVLDLRICRDLE